MRSDEMSPAELPLYPLRYGGISAGLLLRYLYSAPRAPPRWGPGGFFCVILIHVISLNYINYIMESPYHAIKTVTGHCSDTMHPSRLFSSGVGPKLPISDCAAVLSSGSIGCAYGCSNTGVLVAYTRENPRVRARVRMNRELQRQARSNGS